MNNHPIQMSLDATLAPDIELTQFSVPQRHWLPMRTAVSGVMLHLIARRRGGNKMVTLCGLDATRSNATDAEPCGDCEAIARA